jgi:oligopeptide/dipeptide ABC transporter ATP-binding protein
MAQQYILDVRNLKKHFPMYRGILRRQYGAVRAVDGVDFVLREGETLGLVGESGCGKTTLGRVVLRLIEPTAGQIQFRDRNSNVVDVLTANRQQMLALRREMQITFQDPSALNSRMTVKDLVGEPLSYHKIVPKRQLADRVAELLNAVGLNPQHMNRYPHAFSGGQRQRVGLARALALNPRLLVADEPVSALDLSVKAQIINLVVDLQESRGFSLIIISHDLSMVEHISDRVAVMYVGKIVEMAGVDEIFNNPRHPYTEALLSAVPIPDPKRKRQRIILEGNVPSPINPPSGCAFHPRCRYVEAICKTGVPMLESIAGQPDHLSACHFRDTW